MTMRKEHLQQGEMECK